MKDRFVRPPNFDDLSYGEKKLIDEVIYRRQRIFVGGGGID